MLRFYERLLLMMISQKTLLRNRLISAFLIAALSQTPALSLAEETTTDWLTWLDYESKNQVWINPGMISYHFDPGYNNDNWGYGAEYRFANVASVTAGRFYNSDRAYSNYAGVYWQPIGVGPFKVGLVAGGFSGYPQTNNGGWFAAALPAITYENKWVGGNLFVIPTMGDRVHGALSLQLKLKIWE